MTTSEFISEILELLLEGARNLAGHDEFEEHHDRASTASGPYSGHAAPLDGDRLARARTSWNLDFQVLAIEVWNLLGRTEHEVDVTYR